MKLGIDDDTTQPNVHDSFHESAVHAGGHLLQFLDANRFDLFQRNLPFARF